MLPEDIDIVARAIAEVTAPLLERIAVLEARPAVKGEKGDKGDAGEPGAAGVGESGPAGPVGPAGQNGKDADPEVINALVAEAVQKAVALIPVAKDGRDGDDGKDGRDGLSGQPGRDGEKGADGLNGKDGADGLGFDDIKVEHDGERGFLLKFVAQDRQTTFGGFSVPVQIYRGVWRQDTYEAGDTVTWAGSMWHCNGTTNEKPGDGSKAWTLCVKKGSDGKGGPQGPEGKGGPQGPQGPMGPKVY